MLFRSPEDFGISYEPIGNNSQSGKYGAIFNLKRHYGITVPRSMGVEVGAVMKAWTIAHPETDMSHEKLMKTFTETFIEPIGEIRVREYTLSRSGTKVSGQFTIISPEGLEQVVTGEGNGPIDAASNALKAMGYNLTVTDFQEHTRGNGSDAEAVAFVQVSNGETSAYGVGIDGNLEDAAVDALFAAANRLTQKLEGSSE